MKRRKLLQQDLGVMAW